MQKHILTEEDIAKLGITDAMPGENATMEEMIALGVIQPNTAPDGSPIAPPSAPVSEQVTNTPAAAPSMQELLAQLTGTMAAPAADEDPYGKMSKTQRRMLAFAAISDAGRALQGKEGTMVSSLLSDFTDRADQARKAKAAALQAQMMQGLMGGQTGVNGPVDMNDPNAIRALIDQLTAFGMTNPQYATGVGNRVKYLQGELERLEAASQQQVGQQSAIAAVDALLSAPNLDALTGFKGTVNEWFARYGAAPEYSELVSYINKIEGLNFMEAYNELKGGGGISDSETKQATQAKSRLQDAMKSTPEALRLALIEVRNMFNEALMKNPAYQGTDSYTEAQQRALEAARKKREGKN